MSNALISTVEPGDGFGKFAIPADARECMHHLINGTPIEIPRSFYPVLMHRVEAYFGEAIIDTKLDDKIAQLTPISCRLNEAGSSSFPPPLRLHNSSFILHPSTQ